MIVVTGPTGSIGRHLVAQLAATGTPFRAMVRDPATAGGLPGEVVHGDFTEPATLAAAFAGADQLFLNSAGVGPDNDQQSMVRQQVAAIDAARAAGIGHVVKVSVLRAAEGRLLAEGAHGLIESHLRASGLTATVLQPSGFMQNFVTGINGFTPDGDVLDLYGGAGVSYIDAADIAACAAAALVDGAGAGRTHALTGPEVLTASEVAAQIGRAVGRPVGVAALDPSALEARLLAAGVPAAFASQVATLCRDVAAGALAMTTDAVEEMTGTPPHTFTAFAAANADALRAALG